jgi:hypothetical protein
VSEASRLFESREHRVAFFVGAAAVIVGLSTAAFLSWTCDDAFISYRYARNLVEGHGLVFNVGERVEGYTNLLWTLWIAVGFVFHVDPETWSSVSSLLADASTLTLLFAFHLQLRGRLRVSPWTLPVACLVAALHPDFQVFATSGLETAAFTAVTFLGYSLVATGIVGPRARPIAAGVAFGLASMLRPDGTIFAGIAGAALFLQRPRRLRDAILFSGIVAAFYGSTTAFRLAYYGDWFPNTYYAKSADLAFHRQGLTYLLAYLHKYWVLFAGTVAVAYLLRARRLPAPSEGSEADGTADASRRFVVTHALLSLAFVAVYTYYVVRVGGDFMYARLLVPITPYLGILLELGLLGISLSRPVVYLELVASALILMLLTPRPATASDWFSGIADERAVYDDAQVIQRANQASVLRPFFEGLPVHLAFLGTEARLMYDLDIPVAIESETGLTDRAIAHQPLVKRDRIGHEKHADVRYLVQTRQVHFAFARWASERLEFGRYIPLRGIQFGSVSGRILHWDPKLMAELKKRGADFEDFPEYLDSYIARMSTMPRKEVREDYAKFRLFYFEHVDDKERQAAFESRL